MKEQSFNPNATFYKEWEDITSKTRFELLVDQILHYATTYGTDFALGNGYVPNDEPVVIPYEHFKVITPATKEEIFDRCMDMLKSGIALKSDTINVLVEYFVDYDFTDKVNLDEVKNKEAQAVLSDLRSSLIANSRNEDSLFRLYKIYFEKKDYRRAQYYLKQVVALHPANEEFLRLNRELEVLIQQ